MSIPTFSIYGLISWLERQDLATRYNWNCTSGGCLVAHYALAMGLGHNRRKMHTFFFNQNRGEVLTEVAFPQPWDYGAALARAKALVT